MLTSPLARMIPGLLLGGVLVYLALVNWTSEVYIDLVTSELQFEVLSQGESDGSIELILNIPVDSIQLANSTFTVLAKDLIDGSGRSLLSETGSMIVRPTIGDLPSHIRLGIRTTVQLRTLTVRAGSQITISRELDIVTITVASDAAEAPYGRIGLGGEFFVSGENIEIDRLEGYEGSEPIRVTTDPRFPNAAFSGTGGALTLQLFLREGVGDWRDPLLENVMGTRVTFSVVDRTRRGNDRLVSRVKSGIVQIGGVDLVGKRFLLTEHALNESDFLEVSESDIYLIDFVKLAEEGLNVSVFSERAHDVGTGKRSRFVRSIFPSVLDVIVAEPSKKTVWSLLMFVLAQAAVIAKFRRRSS